MKIRTKLKVILLISGIFAAAMTWTILSVSRSMTNSLLKDRTVGGITKGVFELNILTNEYLLTRSPRSIKQWDMQYDSFFESLKNERWLFENNRFCCMEIVENLAKINALFLKLNKYHGDRIRLAETLEEDPAISGLFYARISALSQEMVFVAEKLTDQYHEEMLVSHNRSLLIILISSVGTLILIAVYSFLIFSHILKPIGELLKGAQAIGEGDFDHTIPVVEKNEFGELSESFNKMTRRLGARTQELEDTNRDLKNEMRERELAQNKLREKQAQLVHAGRLVSLGEMATGMAHELNQPLAISRLHAESLLIAQKMPDSARPDIVKTGTAIIRSVDRASDIINHMRKFARADDMDKRKINPLDPAKHALEFFNQQFRNNGIGIETDYGENLPDIFADDRLMEQVMVNFLSNARYAADKRGEQEGNGFRKTITIRVSFDKSGNAVIYEITDNGVGMTPEEKEKCEEPFFTTKGVGEGTGIGLSIVNGIIRGMNGRLEIESEKGEGTTMRVVIPAIAGSGDPDC